MNGHIMLQMRLLPPGSTCFRLYFPRPNVKIHQLVSEIRRPKVGYQVKIEDILIVISKRIPLYFDLIPIFGTLYLRD